MKPLATIPQAHRCRTCSRFYDRATGHKLPNPVGEFEVTEGICRRCNERPGDQCERYFQSRAWLDTVAKSGGMLSPNELNQKLARARMASAVLECGKHKLSAEVSAYRIATGGL